MSSDLEKLKTTTMLDNFADFDTSVEGDDDRPTSGRLVGTRLKFTNQATWVTHPDGTNCSNRILTVSNVRRTEVKWGVVKNRPPIDSRELKAGEKFRDMEVLNAQCPKEEWRMSFGKLKGPWEIQYVLEFVDLTTMDRFSWPTSTIGGSIAVEELVDRVVMKRQFYKRDDIWALVRLTHRFMRTDWEGRERPYLEIVDWYWPKKGEENKLEAAPTEQKALPSTPETVSSAAPETVPPALEKVPEPTLKEEMKDELPY
jgi:hypothetical protein